MALKMKPDIEVEKRPKYCQSGEFESLGEGGTHARTKRKAGRGQIGRPKRNGLPEPLIMLIDEIQ